MSLIDRRQPNSLLQPKPPFVWDQTEINHQMQPPPIKGINYRPFFRPGWKSGLPMWQGLMELIGWPEVKLVAYVSWEGSNHSMYPLSLVANKSYLKPTDKKKTTPTELDMPSRKNNTAIQSRHMLYAFLHWGYLIKQQKPNNAITASRSTGLVKAKTLQNTAGSPQNRQSCKE